MKSPLSKSHIEELANKIKLGTITPAERAEFNDWYSKQIKKTFHVPENIAGNQIELKDRIYERISSELEFKSRFKAIPVLRKLAVAASILLVISISFYIDVRRHDSFKPVVVKNSIPDFIPGQSKAILTLSNGKKIVLDDVGQGKLAAEGNSVIKKTNGKGIIYANSHSHHTSQSLLNTMTTPRGGEYQLTLSDGTKVWLNAASSITYPVSFTGKYREVSVSGEAYFEVAHDRSKPFRVKTSEQTVEVIGTHFNINGYGDENTVLTTLIEGSVSVSSNHLQKVLRPGEQASVGNGTLKTRTIDTDEVIAWKNGYFQFVDADIQTIMRQLGRWYDVDVEFEGVATKETFTGRISRRRKLSQVLQIVQNSKSVHLSFKGRRIMVNQ